MKSLFIKYVVTATIILAAGVGQGQINAAVVIASGPGISSAQQSVKRSVVVSVVENLEVEKGDFRSGRRREVPTSDVDESGRYKGLYDPECSDQFLLTPAKGVVEINISPSIMRDGATTCHWSVVGNDKCISSVTCGKFLLSDASDDKDDPCQDDYLEVTDGSYGFQKFCGQKGPIALYSGKKLRDLYITLKMGKDFKKRKFACSVTCLPNDGSGTKMDDTEATEIHDGCNCGRRPNLDKIVGGEDAKKQEFPWIAALVAAGTRKPYCGASIINNKFILTAAHCFKGPYAKTKNVNVLLNSHKLRLADKSVAAGSGKSEITLTPQELLEHDKADGTLRFKVEKYFIHPFYVKQTNDFDVALLKLEKPIDFMTQKEISPICLPKPDLYLERKAGVEATVAGWGLNASDAAATMSILQKLSMPVFPEDKCKKFYGDRFTRRMLCAGFEEGGKDSCKGDSGGPLISTKTRQLWEQIGVVSFGEGCADQRKPGVYIDTRQVSQWIRYISNFEDASWCNGD